MTDSLAMTFEASPSNVQILRNAFNDETFIFPNRLDDQDAICFDVVLGEGGSGGGDGLEHIHPHADETFIVRSGRLKVVIHGEAHIVKAQQSVTVRRGAPHYFVNAHTGDTHLSLIFDPPQQHRRFFANFATLTECRKNWFSTKGKPAFLLMALVLHRYRDHLYLAGPPVWLQKLIFASLTPVACLLGYRLEIGPEK